MKTIEFQIHYPLEVFNKVMHWVKKSPVEVSGFGNAIIDRKNKIITVTDVYLVNQTNTATSTETDPTDLGRLMYKHKSKGEGAVKVWWHSHANMNTFWSTTDLDTIKQFGGNGFIIATVFNKREEMRSAIGFKTSHPIFGEAVQVVDEVPTFYLHPAEWDQEYDQKVTEYRANTIEPSQTQTSFLSNNDVKNELTSHTNKNIYHNGLLGYGLEAEAEALRISFQKYENFLATASEEELEEKENQLVMLDAAGMFKEDAHGVIY